VKLQMRQVIFSNSIQLLIIISLSLIFGALGFLYSVAGFFDHQTEKIVSLDPFRALTIKEIRGHFLFGFIISIPFKNVKICILTGLMALTIDSDHLLNITGLHIQGRIDHSIPFAIVSSILMAIVTSKVYYKLANANQIISRFFLPTLPAEIIISGNNYKNADTISKASAINTEFMQQTMFYILYFSITMAAFLSHIAYDVFVDDNARFPILAPFSFNQFVIPRLYSLLIEAAGFLLLSVNYQLYMMIMRY
jgi:hypothetical protein